MDDHMNNNIGNSKQMKTHGINYKVFIMKVPIVIVRQHFE